MADTTVVVAVDSVAVDTAVDTAVTVETPAAE
jgi:hypothetical protein